MPDFFDTLCTQADATRTFLNTGADQLCQFAQRLESILKQEHKKIPVRDPAFSTEFAQFCAQLRTDTDQYMEIWQNARQTWHTQFKMLCPSSLQAKSLSLRVKTLSRACDELTTSYNQFSTFYKNYTSAKLPVWILTSCCEDLNNITSKVLFLSREVSKKA